MSLLQGRVLYTDVLRELDTDLLASAPFMPVEVPHPARTAKEFFRLPWASTFFGHVLLWLFWPVDFLSVAHADDKWSENNLLIQLFVTFQILLYPAVSMGSCQFHDHRRKKWQFKYFSKSIHNKLYSFVDLICACHHFPGHFPVAFFFLAMKDNGVPIL